MELTQDLKKGLIKTLEFMIAHCTQPIRDNFEHRIGEQCLHCFNILYWSHVGVKEPGEEVTHSASCPIEIARRQLHQLKVTL